MSIAITIGTSRSPHRLGDGWWLAGAIVLLGAALAIVLALTLGPLERPFGSADVSDLGSTTPVVVPGGYELDRGLVCMQCEPAV